MTKDSILTFRFLRVIAWLIFIGLCIEAGAILVNFVYSIWKPEIVKHLYNDLDLSNMYSRGKHVFFWMYGLILFVYLAKAFLFYLVIELVQKLDITKPFSPFVTQKINQISIFTFVVGVVSSIGRYSTKYLAIGEIEINQLSAFWVDDKAFMLMSGVLFVIASIFKVGVSLQNENDLTV